MAIEAALGLWGPRSFMEGEFTRIRDQTSWAQAPRIQVLGDSVAAGAILGSIVCAGSGSVRNDAIVGGGPAFSALLLEQVIAAGRVPEAVLIAHAPHTFSGTRLPVLVGRFARWSEIPGIFWRSDDTGSVVFGLLTRFSYLLSYRDEIKRLTKGDARFFLRKARARQSEADRLAAHRSRVAQARFQPRALGEGVWPMYQEQFSVSPFVDEYFRRLLDVLEQRGIQAYWVSLPVTERVARTRVAMGYDRRFLSYLDQFRREGRLEFLQRDLLVYDDRYFDDLSHLNMEGALRFSRHLAGRLPGCGPSRAR